MIIAVTMMMSGGKTAASKVLSSWKMIVTSDRAALWKILFGKIHRGKIHFGIFASEKILFEKIHFQSAQF